MTKNRRYEAYYDDLNDRRVREAPLPPCTLPQQAYGGEPLVWAQQRAPVWAWVSWPDRAAERVAAFARGWNDRVVVVEWFSDRGTVDTVVWRNAVTHRST